MTRKEELEALLAKVKAGGDIFPNDFPTWFRKTPRALAAYNGSMDAAMALHDAMLPEYEHGHDGSIAWVKLPGLRTSYRHDSMGGYTSRAWLIAIIKALIKKEGDT